MNNFQTPAGQPPKPHLKLITSMFQGLFPPIQVEKVSLTLFHILGTPAELSFE